MSRPVYVIGVGCTAFQKPRGLVDYPELCVESVTKALIDAGLNYDAIESAFAGFVYGDSTSGQRGLYALGLTGIPIYNVNNNCSTGSSALYLAAQEVRTGVTECSLAVGFEKMQPGSLNAVFNDRANPLDKTYEMMVATGQMAKGPTAAQIFGNGGAEYVTKNGATWENIAAISAKNHQHSVNNPYSQFRRSYTTAEVLADRPITSHLTLPMCSPTSDGGAAAIVASEAFVIKHNLQNSAILIAGMGIATDTTRLFEGSAVELTGADMTRNASKKAYTQAGIGPQDVKVIELHDCFAANELLVYDALGLCKPGKAHDLVIAGDNTYGGKFVVNPSGGLESKGHPLGATGLGMTFYLVNQLRGRSGLMQVPEILPGGSFDKSGKESYALLHNLGLGGSCVVAIFKRPSFFKLGGEDGITRSGYNAADTYRPITQKELNSVKSVGSYSKWADAKM